MNIPIAMALCIVIALILLIVGFIACRDGRDSNLFFLGVWTGVFIAGAAALGVSIK